jgi:peptide/nickel transport system permease protein
VRLTFVRRCSLLFLVIVGMATLFAGFLAPYDPAEQNRDFPYRAPAAESPHRQPIRFFVPGASYRIAGVIPSNLHLFGVPEPGRIFLVGTDALGRDQFSRLLYGGQVTLLAGLLGAAVALLLAIPLGCAAGYFGGWVDALLMRVAELFLALPWLYFLLAVRAFLPLHLNAQVAFFLVAGLVGILGWARPARLIRGVARAAREREFVVAAQSAGARPGWILAHHVFPHVSSVALTQAALLIPQYMLAEMMLSFLGLGISDPVPSWGNMLQAAQQYPVLINDWWMLAPGIVMIPVFWAFAVLVDNAPKRVEFRQDWTP